MLCGKIPRLLMSNALSRRRVISKHTIFTAVNASSDSGVSSRDIQTQYFQGSRMDSTQFTTGRDRQ